MVTTYLGLGEQAGNRWREGRVPDPGIGAHRSFPGSAGRSSLEAELVLGEGSVPGVYRGWR